MFVMCFYLPYAVLEFVLYKDNDCMLDSIPVLCRSYAAIVYTLVCSNATVVFHTVSTWLTVALAVWRWMAVTLTSRMRNMCSMRYAQITIVCAYVSTAVVCIPNYMTFSVHKVNATSRLSGQPVVSYKLDFTVVSHFVSIRTFSFWIYSVLMKLVPCFALTALSMALMRALCEADERRRRLKARPNSQPGAASGATSAEPPSANQRSSDRTTRMLLAVLMLFLITEFPAGILSLLSGIFGDTFFESYYLRVGDILDVLALINSSVNFILYCSMSRQFRKTFALLFTPRWLQHRAPVMATEANATIATTCV
ncbi:FMRFamide receptor-like [Tropilaelaps mercedesae]|uniref:FMRFamide receptor-like n=1 Tax=Tropilaelaps mercedesae TaxID=418985 RepID=A0A1V9XW27_9ACAR|nr:FMRFamide receptor-like [Tropilaelaps mercedesae]